MNRVIKILLKNLYEVNFVNTIIILISILFLKKYKKNISTKKLPQNPMQYTLR